MSWKFFLEVISSVSESESQILSYYEASWDLDQNLAGIFWIPSLFDRDIRGLAMGQNKKFLQEIVCFSCRHFVFAFKVYHNDQFQFIINFRFYGKFSVAVKNAILGSFSKFLWDPINWFRKPEFSNVSRMCPKLHFLTATENSPLSMNFREYVLDIPKPQKTSDYDRIFHNILGNSCNDHRKISVCVCRYKVWSL